MSFEFKEKDKEELEAYLKERKRKSNDERWTYLETGIFWILKELRRIDITLTTLADSIKSEE